MKILKYILIGIAAIIVLFLVLAAFAPRHLKVERTVMINSPKSTVYQHVNNLRSMQAWSPWAERDPNMKLEYKGNDGEVGSSYSWVGNDEVGSGSQTLTGVNENRIDGELKFIEPMETTANTFTILEESNGGTKVTWGFEEDMPYPMNVMTMFMDMDAMLGKDFENGLNKLKTLAENSQTTSSSSLYEVEEIDMPDKTFIGKRGVVKFDKVEEFYMKNFPAIMEAAGKANVEPAGAPCGVYYKWDEKNMEADLAASIPVKDPKAKVKGFETIRIPAGKALKVAYYGAYDKAMDAHMTIDKYIKDKQLSSGDVIEEYVTDPSTEKDTAKWLTNIYYMVKAK